MSLAAPTQFQVTNPVVNGGSAFNIAVTWNSNTAASTMSINSHTYALLDVFDKPFAVVNDLMLAASCTQVVAQALLRVLQGIISNYALKDSQSGPAPFVFVIS